MPFLTLTNSVLLPGLKLIYVHAKHQRLSIYQVETERRLQVCPRCASPSEARYDRRMIEIKDSPIRGRGIILRILKHRYWCKPCGKPFTEFIDGILPKRRTTQRFRRDLLWACENFTDLKRVKRAYQVSNDFIYRALYEQLELRRRTRLYPWPKTIGIDEHAFRRDKRLGRTQFVSMIVDQKNKRVMELVHGKTTADLKAHLSEIPGRENVEQASIDMCDPFKNYIRESFPNAKIVADKFHVLRLLTPALLKKRKEIAGTRADLRAKKLLLMSAKNLGYFERRALWDFLERHPEMKELYSWKESLHGFYRIHGYDRAARALTAMTDSMAASKLQEIKTLRRTLIRWREEILNYFRTRLTNARTEGFNNVAKVIKRRSYGFRNFENYRLRILNACS